MYRILFNGKLQEDDLDFVQTNWGYYTPIRYFEGYKVTYLEIYIEADFDLISTNITSGVFTAGMRHQIAYSNFSWFDVSFTPFAPFISLSLGVIGMDIKYDDGLGVSVSVPLT